MQDGQLAAPAKTMANACRALQYWAEEGQPANMPGQPLPFGKVHA